MNKTNITTMNKTNITTNSNTLSHIGHRVTAEGKKRQMEQMHSKIAGIETRIPCCAAE